MDEKINMSLDDIIRNSRLCHPKLHNSRTCTKNERGRSRSRSRSNSCSRTPYRGQQWRLERGRQQHLTDNQLQRSRSRSRDSRRSSSPVPLLPPVSYTALRSRSLPRQNYTYCNQKRVSVQNMGWRSGFGVNIRKHSLGLSARSTAVFRPSSLHQLRIAKKRVQIAKNILNARHRSYLRQLRQYRHEISEDSFKVPLLKNVQHVPAMFPKTCYHNMFHRRTPMQRVHTEGTLSVTFENELATFQRCTAEAGSVPLGFKSSETLTASPQSIMNGYFTQKPPVEKSTNDDGVYMSTNRNIKRAVATDSPPVLVSSSEYPRLIYKSNECNMGKQRMIHPTNTVRTLNERFSNYSMVCL